MQFTVETPYETYEQCTYSVKQYNNKHVAVQLFCEDGPLATLTVNVTGIERFPENCSCIDTNNCPWGEELVERLGIATFTGSYLHSGFCTYPVYEFSI